LFLALELIVTIIVEPVFLSQRAGVSKVAMDGVGATLVETRDQLLALVPVIGTSEPPVSEAPERPTRVA